MKAADARLVDRVIALFEHAAAQPKFKEFGATGAASRRGSWREFADAVFKVDPASFSHWRTGHGRSEDEEAKTTFRLINILRGNVAYLKDAEICSVAEQVHEFWITDIGQPALDDLVLDLEAHYNGLKEIVLAEGEEARRQLLVPPMTRRGDVTSDPRGAQPGWSDHWTARQVAEVANRFRSGFERAVYFYGARDSGKTYLIAALRKMLEAEVPPPSFLLLDIRSLLAEFQGLPEKLSLYQAILDRLHAQTHSATPPPRLDPDRYDFKIELGKVLSLPRGRRVYLIIANCDAALRHGSPDRAAACIRMTSPLYISLNSAVQGNPEHPYDRLFLIMEGSRPVRMLNDKYPGSPFNKATTEPLQRFSESQWRELAVEAGLGDQGVADRLMAETGGHRSLLWALIRSAHPERPFPQNLAELPLVQEAIDDLAAELRLQPELREALAKAAAGERIGLDDRTRLEHAMFVAKGDLPSLDCPLLERMLQMRGLLPGEPALKDERDIVEADE